MTEMLSAFGAAIASLFIAWLTHRRASKAQKATAQVNHSKLIQEGYQGILEELRSHIASQANRILELEKRLSKEIERREEVEVALNELRTHVRDCDDEGETY